MTLCVFRSSMALADGESSKALQELRFKAAVSEKLKCIGMKRTVLAKGK